MKKVKLLKVLFIFVLIMIIAIFVLKKYVIEEPSIAEKISSYMPFSVSLNDSIHIKAYSTSAYLSLLNSGNFEGAYNMLTEEYKKYMPYDRYLENLKDYDYTNLVSKSVKQLSDYTYVVTLENRNTKEEHAFLVYTNKFNNKIFTISPDGFIYYDNPNMKVVSNGIEATLEDYTVFQDSISINLNVKNKTSNDTTIDDVKVELTLAGRLSDKFEKVTLAPNEERKVNVTYIETSYYVPKNILLEMEKTTIVFELN